MRTLPVTGLLGKELAAGPIIRGLNPQSAAQWRILLPASKANESPECVVNPWRMARCKAAPARSPVNVTVVMRKSQVASTRDRYDILFLAKATTSCRHDSREAKVIQTPCRCDFSEAKVIATSGRCLPRLPKIVATSCRHDFLFPKTASIRDRHDILFPATASTRCRCHLRGNEMVQ